MYNGRAQQPSDLQHKQLQQQQQQTVINPTLSQWGRPRKGSYCQYKQQKLSKINTTLNNFQPNGVQLNGGTISRNVSRGKIQGTSNGYGVGTRRNSVSFYEKDLGRSVDGGREIGREAGRADIGRVQTNLKRSQYQTVSGLQKYNSRDLVVQASKKSYSKQAAQYELPNKYRTRQQNYMLQYQQPQKKMEKNYQSELTSAYKSQQIKSYTDIRQNPVSSYIPASAQGMPAGSIISTATRKQRIQSYQNLNDNSDININTNIPARENGGRLRQRQYERDDKYQRRQSNFAPNLNTNINSKYPLDKYQRKQIYYEGAQLDNGNKYEKYDKFNRQDPSQRPERFDKNQKYAKFNRNQKYDKYDQNEGQYVSRRQMQKLSSVTFMPKSPRQYKGQQYSKSPIYNKNTHKPSNTDRQIYQTKKYPEQQPQHSLYPTQANPYPDHKYMQNNLTTPTRPKSSQYSSIQHPSQSSQQQSTLQQGGMLTQSRKQLLIQKSKMLLEKANQYSASKKMERSQRQGGRQRNDLNTNGNQENYQERLERIKNNKQRFYDSPFKGRVQSSVDLKTKYSRQPQQDVTHTKPSESCQNILQQKTDLNTHTSIQRSQQLIKKLSTISATANNFSKPQTNAYTSSSSFISKNQQNTPYTPLSTNHPIKTNPVSHTNTDNYKSTLITNTSASTNDCMGRINVLNNKINEKINSLINAYERKQKN